jgi:hypothetical protein
MAAGRPGFKGGCETGRSCSLPFSRHAMPVSAQLARASPKCACVPCPAQKHANPQAPSLQNVDLQSSKLIACASWLRCPPHRVLASPQLQPTRRRHLPATKLVPPTPPANPSVLFWPNVTCLD